MGKSAPQFSSLFLVRGKVDSLESRTYDRDPLGFRPFLQRTAEVGLGPEEAPTLVFLHEGLGSASSWRDFAPRLATETGCGALVYSRAGYGASDPAPPHWPVRFMHDEAIILAAVLDAMAIQEPILVGHSDGASIALIYTGSAPKIEPKALALEAPHVFVEPLTVASIAKLPGRYAEGDLERKLRRQHGDNTDRTFHAWTEVWLSPAFRNWDSQEYLPGVGCPVLIVQGERDEYGTLRQVEAITASVAGPVETVILANSGHSPHRERPGETFQAMARFLRKVLSDRYY
ncbi:MAG TPA: alpha/beta hydrolase [Thermoanaerobaculia bacterium]|nr:alpha/beta hydrolase [Thermoanaerobaculia bacterium]